MLGVCRGHTRTHIGSPSKTDKETETTRAAKKENTKQLEISETTTNGYSDSQHANNNLENHIQRHGSSD